MPSINRFVEQVKVHVLLVNIQNDIATLQTFWHLLIKLNVHLAYILET